MISKFFLFLIHWNQTQSKDHYVPRTKRATINVEHETATIEMEHVEATPVENIGLRISFPDGTAPIPVLVDTHGNPLSLPPFVVWASENAELQVEGDKQL